ncbi:MAG: hypothetical protein K8I00_05080, partial [Candidatus Omnitrophica bacterium]|nr:hypothetical protein [Candidatus Omnitrophota bacterium]
KADYIWYSLFQPYPKLPITEQLQREGRLAGLQPADYFSTFFKGSLLKQDNIDELVNLHKFYLLAIKCPWLKPLIRKLIKLPPNWFFEQIFIVSFAWTQLTCYRRSLRQLLAMGVGNLKVYYEKGNKISPVQEPQAL